MKQACERSRWGVVNDDEEMVSLELVIVAVNAPSSSFDECRRKEWLPGSLHCKLLAKLD